MEHMRCLQPSNTSGFDFYQERKVCVYSMYSPIFYQKSVTVQGRSLFCVSFVSAGIYCGRLETQPSLTVNTCSHFWRPPVRQRLVELF